MYLLILIIGCIISSFYIKPQLKDSDIIVRKSCIISSFYIKPQQGTPMPYTTDSCIISSFYIKPQQEVNYKVSEVVVLYLHSTSNHNRSRLRK